MYLKSLVIKGFKSFADRSVVNFEPGISVIVGPNGSGKSNISEAVQWVLGERNPRNMRVQSLEELIFSGSSARKAVGVAEVDLVLDNSDGKLPIDFNQVAITRRMYRSGESEYFINGSPCRRMDVIDILYDSGIGQGANSIIGQGNLTAVLESRPEDRRALIEDAAGILKHKKRRERANRKLDQMDASLNRVNDIIQVIESQLRPLERQAKRAQQYQELADELKNLDLALAVDDLRLLQGEWNQLSKQIKEIDAEAELAHFRLNERDAELNKRQRALEEKGLFAGDINEQRIRCLAIIQRLNAGMLLLEEKGKNLVSQLSGLRATLHTSESRLSNTKTELTQTETAARESDSRLEALYSGYNELTRASETITKARREAEERYSSITANCRNLESALDKTRMNLNKANESLASLKIEDDLFKEQKEQLGSEHSASQQILAASNSRLQELETEIKKQENESKLAKLEIDKFVRLLDARQCEKNKQRERLATLRAELKSLEEIDRAFQTASPALRWVVEHKGNIKGVVGPLAECIHVRRGATLPDDMTTADLERLTERLLGSDLFSLLVKDGDSALRTAKALTDNGEQTGPLALLPLAGMRPITEVSANGIRLLDFLEYPLEYAEVFSALLGDIYLCASVADAQKFHFRDPYGLRYVTKEAAIVWPNGKLTFGAHTDDIDGVLERRRKMEQLALDLEGQLTRVSEAELAVSNAEDNLAAAQEDGFAISQVLAKLNGDCNSVREEVTRLQKQLSAMLSRLQECERRLTDISRRREQTEPLAGEYEQRIISLEEQLQQAKEQVEVAYEQLKAANEEKNVAAERLSETKIELETCKSQASYAATRVKALRQEIEQLEQQASVSAKTLSSLEQIRQRISPLHQLYQELYTKASEWAQKLHDQAQLEQTDSSNLRKVISDAQKAVDEARAALEEINERRTEIRIEQGKLESNVKHAIERITNEHGESIEAALQVPALDDRITSEDRVRRLRSRIESIGAVNQVAAGEYQALKARRDYMIEQISDLTEARKALSKIAAALDKKMRNRYLETFSQVNKNFSEIFSILFPGGKGELIMLTGDTEEQNGVEVSAQPQGKKITKLSMMSGGEKSLVAIALLFAIYRIRSVPFYILDEVEAALDDTNLRRLLEYLTHLRNATQLILVSHQRRTMECADVLYGVTMQAAGVSKLVSQRLEQALGYASAEVADIEKS